MGAYQAGANPALDEAIVLHPRLVEGLRQMPGQSASLQDTVGRLERILAGKDQAT
jgi:flagellar biosynthesis/type III secretory pathway ATPase